MKAAICYEFGKPLAIEDIDIDSPQAGEVKVKLAACAICHSDIHAIEGAWGGSLPVVYVHDAAGIVEAFVSVVTFAQLIYHFFVTLIRSCVRCYFFLQGDPHLCDCTFSFVN